MLHKFTLLALASFALGKPSPDAPSTTCFQTQGAPILAPYDQAPERPLATIPELRIG
jgi:hypothetical protein